MLVVVLLGLLRSSAFAADLFGNRPALEEKITAIVEPYLVNPSAEGESKPAATEDQKTSGESPAAPAKSKAWAVVVGVANQDARHIFGYGRLSADSHQRPDGHTLFEIGSVTKTFTALLLADFVERGEVKLDDPVRLYLPESVKVPTHNDKEITLLHLATHTSALPRIPTLIGLKSLISQNPYKDYTPDDLYKTLGRTTLGRDPGEQFEYSNLAFGLLGVALSRKAGVPFEDLVVERICKPLTMPDTRVHLTADQQKRFATPYDGNGKQSSTWEFDAIAGAGALRSTADDMLTYLQANMGFKQNPLLPAIRLCHESRHDAGNKNQSVGLAWHMEKWPHESRLLFHGGGTGGYNCLVGFMEQKDRPTIAIVVLSNTGPAPTGMVANDVGVKVLRLLTSE